MVGRRECGGLVTDIADLTFITMVGDVDTPLELRTHIGKVVGVPDSTALSNATKLYGLPGRARQQLGVWEWVLGTEQDRLATLIDSIPGGSWASAEARQTYVQLGRQLTQRGITVAQARTALTNAYNAALLDKTTRG